jgi:hypothetical protein
MTLASHLSSRDIGAELERLYQARPERRKLVAFFGEGEDSCVDTSGAGRFDVVPIGSELALREALLKYEDAESRAAFLVPWCGELPLDLGGRFVQNGRIFRIGAAARLSSLFGATELEDAALRSPLAGYLLRADNPRTSYPRTAGRLTAAAMWEAWLALDVEVDIDGGLALDTFLGWAALNARGEQLRQELDRDEARGVRDALFVHLAAQLGPAGPIVWRLWEQGRGRAALELGVLFEPLVAHEHAAVRMWLRLIAKSDLGCSSDEEAMQVVTTLGNAAGVALRAVERRAGSAEAFAIVRAADSRPVEAEVREALRASTRLPSSWQMRLAALGDALVRGANSPSAETLAAARQAQSGLEGHALFKEETYTAAVERAEMAVRLLAWLVARPDRALHIRPAPQAEAEVLAQWYSEDGGYLDLARQRARGSSEGAFGQGVEAVTAKADHAREELDQRFSQALVRWVEAGRPASQVLPIDLALKSVAARFLLQSAQRKLLVLLVDGMGWAQAVELLESLGSRAPAWGPASWHTSKDGRIAESQRYPVVLAGLPTMTETSRAAFFSGKPMAPGDPSDSSKDPERFASHKELRALFEGSAAPRLLLRSAGHTSFGAATTDARRLVRDSTERVVGIVVNAIDDSLKSSTQEVRRWTADSIRSLADLLDDARVAGRAVLLASDHGHVPADRLHHVGSGHPGGGARWRPWNGQAADLGAHEIGVSGPNIHTPKGAAGVVLLANDASCYCSSTHAGEHGGATLAEVVAPCVLLAFDDPVQSSTGDKALVPTGAVVPEWWHYEVQVDRQRRTAGEPPRQSPTQRKKAKTLEGQLQLPSLPAEPLVAAPTDMPTVTTTPAGSIPPPDMTSPFAQCDMLQVRAPRAADRKLVVQAVHYLLARGGFAAGNAFATALGFLPFRVPGLVSSLQEVLNIDGYAVLSFDSAGKQVRLDREKLEQQFEVRL